MIRKIQNYWLEHIQPKIVKCLLFVTKGDFLYISIALVLTVVIIIWSVKSQTGWNNVVELSTFSAVVLEGALVAVVGLLRSVVQGLTEDPEKLTDDYKELVKRYSSEANLIWTRNNDNSLTVFPVIHVAWLYDKELVVKDFPEKEFVLPQIIDEHYEELYNTHVTSKIYNNTNVRVDDWYTDESKGEFHLVTGRTSYYNSLVTNRTMDYEIKKGISVRELLECGPMVHPLKYSKLSNHLGFNGFVETSDHKIIFIKRKSNVSIGKRTWGDSVGASLKAKYALDEQFRFSEDGLFNAIVREIEDELGIPALMLEKTENNRRVKLIAAYRDMLEGGKPQLLFYAKACISSNELKSGFKQINSEIPHKKLYSRDNNEQEMETDGFELYAMDLEELRNCMVYPDKIIHSGKIKKMLPSASACVSLFQLYLDFTSEKGTRKVSMLSFGMSVLEKSVIGKAGINGICEDGLFCGKRFVAVIDGVTSKTNERINNKTTGQIATETILEVFSQLDNMAFKYTDTPYKVLSLLDKSLASEMDRQNKNEYEELFKASVIYFDRLNKTVVSYGDCKCRIGDAVYGDVKKVDRELSEKRSVILKQALSEGKNIDDLRMSDVGRTAIIQDMQEYYSYENESGNEYGYPVLNGRGVNKTLIKLYAVHPGEEVILCSDGYPKVCSSLKDSEQVLLDVLKEDPLLIGENRYGYMSTKAHEIGNVSFDDRAWVKLG